MYSNAAFTKSNSFEGRVPSPHTEIDCGDDQAFKRWKYLRRLLKFRQMDFEYAFWQMLYLLVAPQKVFRNFQYRKNTKNQFARDDPAFLVLLSFALLVSTIGFTIVLGMGVVGFIRLILWVILIDCIGVGLLVATFMWYLSNRFMRMDTSDRSPDMVEWAYCFDVHLNAFFPLLVVLHFMQLFFVNLILHDALISRILGNTFWLCAIAYYFYITFLGFSALPFLRRTRALLYPFTGLVVFYILSNTLGWNLTRGLCEFYKYRAL